jgi:hypothetical protein
LFKISLPSTLPGSSYSPHKMKKEVIVFWLSVVALIFLIGLYFQVQDEEGISQGFGGVISDTNSKRAHFQPLEKGNEKGQVNEEQTPPSTLPLPSALPPPPPSSSNVQTLTERTKSEDSTLQVRRQSGQSTNRLELEWWWEKIRQQEIDRRTVEDFLQTMAKKDSEWSFCPTESKFGCYMEYTELDWKRDNSLLTSIRDVAIPGREIVAGELLQVRFLLFLVDSDIEERLMNANTGNGRRRRSGSGEVALRVKFGPTGGSLPNCTQLVTSVYDCRATSEAPIWIARDYSLTLELEKERLKALTPPTVYRVHPGILNVKKSVVRFNSASSLKQGEELEVALEAFDDFGNRLGVGAFERGSRGEYSANHPLVILKIEGESSITSGQLSLDADGFFRLIVPLHDVGDFDVSLFVEAFLPFCDADSFRNSFDQSSSSLAQCPEDGTALLQPIPLKLPFKTISVIRNWGRWRSQGAPVGACTTGSEPGRWISASYICDIPSTPEGATSQLVQRLSKQAELCKEMTSGSWSKHSHYWLPYECHYPLFSKKEVSSCLERNQWNKILFFGDSTTNDLRSTLHQLFEVEEEGEGKSQTYNDRVMELSKGIVTHSVYFEEVIASSSLSFQARSSLLTRHGVDLRGGDNEHSLMLLNTGSWELLPRSLFARNFAPFCEFLHDLFPTTRLIWLDFQPFSWPASKSNFFVEGVNGFAKSVAGKRGIQSFSSWDLDFALRTKRNTPMLSRTRLNALLNQLCQE